MSGALSQRGSDDEYSGHSDSMSGSVQASELVALVPGAAQAIEAATQALRPHWHCLGALVAQGESMAATAFRRSIKQRLQKLASRY